MASIYPCRSSHWTVATMVRPLPFSLRFIVVEGIPTTVEDVGANDWLKLWLWCHLMQLDCLNVKGTCRRQPNFENSAVTADLGTVLPFCDRNKDKTWMISLDLQSYAAHHATMGTKGGEQELQRKSKGRAWSFLPVFTVNYAPHCYSPLLHLIEFMEFSRDQSNLHPNHFPILRSLIDIIR